MTLPPPGEAPRDDLEIEAAEYVLGLLPPSEAHILAARTFTEPGLAARIEGWERRLLPLATLVDPVDPPDILWRRLALATGTEAPAPPTPQTRPRTRFWPGAAAGAFAMAASLAVFLLARPQPSPNSGIKVAVLTAIAAPDPVVLIRQGTGDQGLNVVASAPDVPQGRSLEVWAIRPGTTAAESVGLLPTQGAAPLQLALPIGTQLLVSQEPAGGSPTKQPTGPVVMHGGVYGL